MSSKPSIVSREVLNRGNVVVLSNLDQGYYDYGGGSEAIALDRVAESIFDIIHNKEIPLGGVEINLGFTVSVGEEVAAANIPQLLVLEVMGFDKKYEQIEEFEKLLMLVGQIATEKLISKGKRRYKVNTEYNQYIVVY